MGYVLLSVCKKLEEAAAHSTHTFIPRIYLGLARTYYMHRI